jgi:hypothetical protein
LDQVYKIYQAVKSILLILCMLYCHVVLCQNQKGIAFQAVARTSNGVVMPNKLIQIRISILKDTFVESIMYQEIKSVTTSPLGLFTILIGTSEPAKIVTIGAFEKINWTAGTYFMRVEIDLENRLQFIRIGQQQIQYAAYAFSADHLLADNLEGVLSIPQGGTGVNNLNALKLAMQIDKINNVPDSLKILSKASIQALTLKLDKKDTASLSNRINLKLNKGEITASELAIGLGFLPVEIYFGAFTDTARQTALVNTATAVKWRDTIGLNKTAIGLNTSLDPTKILVAKAGVYLVQYSLQVTNTQVANDEISIWIRRNGAAYPNTLRQFSTGAVGIKNFFTGQVMMLFGEDDYLELFFSVKHNQTQLLKTSSLTNPSRPATPSAQMLLYRIQ